MNTFLSKSLSFTSSLKPMFSYIKKQQEDRKFMKSVEITATFILITFFMYFAIRPTLLTISALKGEIDSKKLLKEELRKKINDVILAQDRFSQVQEKYLIVNSALPDRPNYYQAAWEILNTAQDHGVSTDELRFILDDQEAKQITDPNINIYTVGVGTTGPFTSLVDISFDLLNSRRLLNIASLRFSTTKKEENINPETTQGASNILNSFSANFYYWKEGGNVKK